MNKKTKLKLNETLNKALEPPRTRDKSKLDELLNLYDVQEKPKLEMVSEVKVLPNNTQPNPTQHKITQHNQVEVSPIKDFTKVPNSITKEAIPQKFFKGLSKHTYDILYRHTRGNIKPVRKIQLTKSEIMKLTGLSFNTIQTHIRYLREAGLVKVEFNIGKHEGSVYEIVVPEEISNPTQPNPTQDNPTQDKTASKTQPDTTQKLGILGVGNVTENKDTYENPKTSLKTNTKNDDEAFASFIEKFQKACERLTGKQLSRRDSDKLSDLADLLILELEVAARRTNSISNVPAFLTEILRRQFFASHKQQFSSKSPKVKKDTVGKAESDSYEIKPLDEKGREEALAQLREFAADDFLQDFKKWYTTEDWTWLIENLGVSDK